MQSSFLPSSFFGASNPEIPATSRYSQFLAQVAGTKLDSREFKDKSQVNALLPKQVAFNICGLPEFTDRYPVANPMFDHVREMKVGDLILVRDMGEGCVHTFFYVPYREDDFVGLWNQSNVISVSKDKKIKILMFPDGTALKKPENAEADSNAIGSIIMENNGGKVSVTIKASNITIDGDLSVTGSANFEDSVTVTKEISVKNIALSTHVHATAAPGTPSGPISPPSSKETDKP